MMMDCGVAMPGDPSSVWRRAVTLVTTSVAIMMTYCLAADHPSSFSSWSCSFHSAAPVTDKDFLSFLIFPFRVFRFPLWETIFFSKKNRSEKYLLKIHYMYLFQRHRWPPHSHVWVHLLVLGYTLCGGQVQAQCFGGVETYEKTSGTTVCRYYL